MVEVICQINTVVVSGQRSFTLVLVKQLVKSVEKFTLVCLDQFHEKRGVVISFLVCRKSETNFTLAIVGRFVSLICVAPSEGPGLPVLIVHPGCITVVSSVMSKMRRCEVVKGFNKSVVENIKVALDIRRWVCREERKRSRKSGRKRRVIKVFERASKRRRRR